MKRIIIILLLVLGVHVTISSRAQAPTIAQIQQGKLLSNQQKKELLGLNRRYHYQTEQLCDYCKQGTNVHYVQRTSKEFQYKKQQLQAKLKKTIENIVAFYAQVGIAKSEIQNERTRLLSSLNYWS